jgi:predicted DNA-binding protein (UPF0278 family)
VLQECYDGVTRVLKNCYKSVARPAVIKSSPVIAAMMTAKPVRARIVSSQMHRAIRSNHLVCC